MGANGRVQAMEQIRPNRLKRDQTGWDDGATRKKYDHHCFITHCPNLYLLQRRRKSFVSWKREKRGTLTVALRGSFTDSKDPAFDEIRSLVLENGVSVSVSVSSEGLLQVW